MGDLWLLWALAMATGLFGTFVAFVGTVAILFEPKNGEGGMPQDESMTQDEVDEVRLERWIRVNREGTSRMAKIARLVERRISTLTRDVTAALDGLDEARQVIGAPDDVSLAHALRQRVGTRHKILPVGMSEVQAERAEQTLAQTVTWTEEELWGALLVAGSSSTVRGLCATALRARAEFEEERQQLRGHITRAVSALSVSLPAGATQGKDLIGIAELLNDRALAHNRESAALAGLLDKMEDETLQAAALRVTTARDLAQEGLAAELTAKEARAGSPDAHDQLTEDLAKVRSELGEIRKLVMHASDQSTLSGVQDVVRDLFDTTTRAVKLQRSVAGALGHAKYADPAESELLEELDTLRTVLGAHPDQLTSVRTSDVMGELKLLHEHVASEPTQTFRPPYRVIVEHDITEHNGKHPPKAMVVFEIRSPEFFNLPHGQRLGVVVLHGE